MDWSALIKPALLLKLGGKFLGWATRLLPPTPRVPTETVRIVRHPLPAWWHMGRKGGVPAMQVDARFYVTNVTDNPVSILGCKLKPTGANQVLDGDTATRHPEENVYSPEFPILPGCTSDVSISVWIFPPMLDVGQELTADILLIDQFGNEHKCPQTTFENR